MTLDVRANRAASSIRASVTDVTPVPLSGVVGRRRTGLAFGLALAAVIAFGSLALASVLTDHDLDSAATTIPGSPTTLAIVATGGGDPVGVTITQQNTSSDSPAPYAKFSGTAPAGTTILASSPYGSADAVAGEGGTWSLTVPFTGAPAGETFGVTVTIGGTPYEFPFTCSWDPENVEITAFQSYGSSDAAEPYDVFYGSAPAGTPVVVTSEYGSADTTAGEHGEWEVKVRFTDAPHHEPFSITVKVGDRSFAFGFIWLRGDGDVTTTTTTAEPVALAVHQWNTSSESPEPYLKVYGTAPAGTHVLLQSEYGASDLVVEGGGEFSLKLWFSPLPPPGVPFPVTLKIDHEYYTTYHFTSWFDPSTTTVTVEQYNTETDSPDPYAKFYGTAPIGTHVVLQSEYGSTDWNTESVNWTGKLYFSTLPPAGQTFTITVKIDGDVYGTYPFTSWYSPDLVAVTAHRSFGSCAESPPYDVYYGTAPPGTAVTITSAYSDTVVFTVGATGNWEKKVFFPESPIDTEIDVTVTVGETVFHFGFTHLAA